MCIDFNHLGVKLGMVRPYAPTGARRIDDDNEFFWTDVTITIANGF